MPKTNDFVFYGPDAAINAKTAAEAVKLVSSSAVIEITAEKVQEETLYRLIVSTSPSHEYEECY